MSKTIDPASGGAEFAEVSGANNNETSFSTRSPLPFQDALLRLWLLGETGKSKTIKQLGWDNFPRRNKKRVQSQCMLSRSCSYSNQSCLKVMNAVMIQNFEMSFLQSSFTEVKSLRFSEPHASYRGGNTEKPLLGGKGVHKWTEGARRLGFIIVRSRAHLLFRT